jgi:excisionase family DNA binding protein
MSIGHSCRSDRAQANLLGASPGQFGIFIQTTGTSGICDLSLPEQRERRLWHAKQELHPEVTIVQDLQLLTCDEVAQVLRVSAETVRHLAAAGELPGRKIGRAWRFPRVTIEAFLLDTTTEAHRRVTDSEERQITQVNIEAYGGDHAS